MRSTGGPTVFVIDDDDLALANAGCVWDHDKTLPQCEIPEVDATGCPENTRTRCDCVSEPNATNPNLTRSGTTKYRVAFIGDGTKKRSAMLKPL